MIEREAACFSGAGATAEKRQVPLHIDEPAGEEETGGEAKERRSNSPKRTKRTCGGKKQARNK